MGTSHKYFKSEDIYAIRKNKERERYYKRVKPLVSGKYSPTEDAVVLDKSLTAYEVAVILKRSVKSIEGRRHYLRKMKGGCA